MSNALRVLFVLAATAWFVTFTQSGLLRDTAPMAVRAEQRTMAEAAKIVGPEETEDNCATCHYLEAEAWQATRHNATFTDRHSSPRALEILKAMGERTMKRSGACLSCHYTSVAEGDSMTPKWGVSCESCHSPAKDWVSFHNRPGGDPSASAMKYAAGKDEPADSRLKRLGSMAEKGGITSIMIYDIAANCYECHTVPDENLVNKGGHRAGSDFELVSWSQGEIRHNFVSSAGAPAKPTNRPATAEQRRRLFVVGALVDLETSLRNLGNVKEKGGAYHKAMVDRANRMRTKVDEILKATPLAEVSTALAALPSPVTADTSVPVAALDGFRNAGRMFAEKNDGTGLGALDGMIPKDAKGAVHRP
jgi:hypothetical protein